MIPFGIENLDTSVLSIADIDPSIFAHRYTVDDVELSRACAGFTPRSYVLAIGRVFVHLSIAVTVSDIDIPVSGVDSHVRWPIEGLATHRRRMTSLLADGHQQLAIGGELSDGMVTYVDAEYRVIGPDSDAV